MADRWEMGGGRKKECMTSSGKADTVQKRGPVIIRHQLEFEFRFYLINSLHGEVQPRSTRVRMSLYCLSERLHFGATENEAGRRKCGAYILGIPLPLVSKTNVKFRRNVRGDDNLILWCFGRWL